MQTPWGTADHVETYDNGVVRVSTPSHGGMFCNPELNERVPEPLRNADGWYEEDLDAHCVVVAFPECFGAEDVEQATKVIRDWYPERYEAWTGQPATPENSHKAAEKHFRATHAADFVSIAAFGSWHDRVPEGMAGVAATPGGDRDVEAVYFLVPAEEYQARSRFGFVVDESRHERIEPLA